MPQRKGLNEQPQQSSECTQQKILNNPESENPAERTQTTDSTWKVKQVPIDRSNTHEPKRTNPNESFPTNEPKRQINPHGRPQATAPQTKHCKRKPKPTSQSEGSQAQEPEQRSPSENPQTTNNKIPHGRLQIEAVFKTNDLERMTP